MRGRKATPNAVLKLRGSTRARSSEITLPAMADVPAAPTWLDKNAREKWVELAPLLCSAGVLTAADVDRLADYCVAYSRWRKSERRIGKGGEVIVHRNGVEGLSHWLRVGELALNRMDRSGAALGLSPADRVRLKGIEAKPPSKREGMSKFFAKG